MRPLDATGADVLRRITVALSLLAVALSIFGRRLGLLDFRPGGASFGSHIRPVFLAIFLVGILLSLRWQLAGGIVAAFAAGGVMAFAVQQLEPRHAAIAVAAYLVPAVLWTLASALSRPLPQALGAVALATVVGVGGLALGDYVYDRIWGPTHPESELSALTDSPVEWVWAGAVTTDSAEVRFKATTDWEIARLAVSMDPEFSSPDWIDVTSRSSAVGAIVLEGLDPDTRHYYAVEVDGRLDVVRSGSFRTLPSGPSSFTLAFGACARVGSNGRVFDTIRELDPLMYVVAGDFHYGDTDVDDVDEYREVLDLTLTRPAQAALYRSVPIAYVWDDHDYGANDADGTSVARAAAMSAYREYVPSYELAGPDEPVYQAFTVGRVRVILTDARAGRDPKSTPDDASKTMLGESQKTWLLKELGEGARTHELVLWLNPVPWVGEARAGSDTWAGYSTERGEIAEFIAANGLTNLVMVSGDAHMVAIDDGTNTNYSSQPGPGFPLLHIAALDRPGSTKGGPYSHGAIAGGGHFGTVEIVDEGGPMHVTLRAHDWTGDVLLEHDFDVPAPADAA